MTQHAIPENLARAVKAVNAAHGPGRAAVVNMSGAMLVLVVPESGEVHFNSRLPRDETVAALRSFADQIEQNGKRP